MRTVAKGPSGTPRKKLVLVRGRASDILASVHVGKTEERRAKAAIAAVTRLEAVRAAAAAHKAVATKRQSAKKAVAKQSYKARVQK
jgi:hypothetical protein